MNPLTWDAPKIVVYLALFCIVFCRSQATYWIGRGLIVGLSHSRLVARMTGAIVPQRHQKNLRKL